MHDNDVLDNWEFEKNDARNQPPAQSDGEESVALLKTFNTEEEAYVAAAALENEGIKAQVIAATTGQLTPFAYGNIRLYVAESQVEDAYLVIANLKNHQEVYDNPRLSAGRIMVILLVGLFVIGLVLRLLGLFFDVLQAQ